MKGILYFLLFLPIALNAQDLTELYRSGRSAYDSGKYSLALGRFQTFDSIRSNYPPVNAYLAILYSRMENKKQAITYLRKTAIISADTTLLAREDFDIFRESEEFGAVTNQFLDMLTPVKHSELAFILQNKEIHPESISYDPNTSRFYISSIRLRMIFMYENGRLSTFKQPGEDSLLAVMGMDVDPKGNVLWVSSAKMAQMKNKNGPVGSYVHVYDLKDGKLLRKFHLDDPDILLGDLTVAPDGTAVMTNSKTPAIYKANLDSVFLYKSFPELNNLQGLAYGSAGGLYFSDYISGIYRYDGTELTHIGHDTSISTKGIDGLYFRKGNLIGIQNGVFPMRISQYVLNAERNRIERVIYLDKNLPEMQEPVQGTWVGDWFYFIANSPWDHYNDDDDLVLDNTPFPEIWRVNLLR